MSMSAAFNFRLFVTRNKGELSGTPLREIVSSFGRPIRLATAATVCAQMGLCKQRCNRTRYGPFWNQLNWELPDAMLAAIWCVDRGNLRARRTRLRKRRPRWHLAKHQRDHVFRAAVALERTKARRFTRPRPAGPA